MMDGRMEGQTDRPYFIGPFRSRPWVQKLHNIYCKKQLVLLDNFGNQVENHQVKTEENTKDRIDNQERTVCWYENLEKLC